MAKTLYKNNNQRVRWQAARLEGVVRNRGIKNKKK